MSAWCGFIFDLPLSPSLASVGWCTFSPREYLFLFAQGEKACVRAVGCGWQFSGRRFLFLSIIRGIGFKIVSFWKVWISVFSLSV